MLSLAACLQCAHCLSRARLFQLLLLWSVHVKAMFHRGAGCFVSSLSEHGLWSARILETIDQVPSVLQACRIIRQRATGGAMHIVLGHLLSRKSCIFWVIACVLCLGCFRGTLRDLVVLPRLIHLVVLRPHRVVGGSYESWLSGALLEALMLRSHTVVCCATHGQVDKVVVEVSLMHPLLVCTVQVWLSISGWLFWEGSEIQSIGSCISGSPWDSLCWLRAGTECRQLVRHLHMHSVLRAIYPCQSLNL